MDRTVKLELETVGFMPEKIEQGKLYYSPKYFIAKYLCPCGCGNEVVIDFNRPGGGGWRIDPETVTVTPSIYSKGWPCKSHYFITNGKIIWC